MRSFFQRLLTSHLRVSWVLPIALALGACHDDLPTTVLLDIQAAPQVVGVDHLWLSVYSDRGVDVARQRVPKEGKAELPSQLVLYPAQDQGELRLDLWAASAADTTVGEGIGRVMLIPGAQARALIVLQAGVWPDMDFDGIPDAIDDCPSIPDPKQDRPCASADGGLDGLISDGRGDGVADTRPDGVADMCLDTGLDMQADIPVDVTSLDGQPAVAIHVTSPAAGDAISAGSTTTIRWTIQGTIAHVRLELFRGSSRIATLQSHVSAVLHRWTWPVGVALADASTYHVEIVDEASGIRGKSADFSVMNWLYRHTVTVDTSALSTTLTGYPVAVRLGPAEFNYAHAKANGADLRASVGTALGTFELPLWIEHWNPSGQSLIWVQVPTLDPTKPATFNLFFGNATASSVSSEAKTFDQAFVSSGYVTGLSGTKSYQRFELKLGDTLELSPGKTLRIEAQKIVLHGQVDGFGRGHPAPATATSGLGPGGGLVGTNAGGGGGGHGGAGGAGGIDSGDTLGLGGKVYGSSTSQTFGQGSSGGSGFDSGGYTYGLGGAGGGALALVADTIVIDGKAIFDGDNGAQGGRCGGGGAGGGLLLIGRTIQLAAPISAWGGNGGEVSPVGVSDGGGGGGGGRVKVFWQATYTHTSTIDVGGGAGAQGGDASPGQDGAPGTISAHKQSYSRLRATLGSEVSL